MEARARRVARLDIQPLCEADEVRFAEAWRALQIRFVDEPAAAIAEADRLVGEVMTARGYPLGDFDQRAADISVDDRVSSPTIAPPATSRAGRTAAKLRPGFRQAVIHYRALFEDLLGRHDMRSYTPTARDERELVEDGDGVKETNA